MGHERSGSTIFDIMLSNSKNVVGVGELTWLERILSEYPDDVYCSCSCLVRECPFWVSVVSQLNDKGYTDLNILQKQKREIENRSFFWNYIKGNANKDLVAEYNQYNINLFEEIFRVSGADVIVDSSKSAPRAFYLSLLNDYDVYIFHTVRDPRGMAWSKKKGFKKDPAKGITHDIPPQPITKTIRSWLGNSILALRVKQHTNANYMLINYDRLNQETDTVLQEASNMTGVDFSDVVEIIRKNEELRTFHVVAGNRVRATGKIKLKYDNSWKGNLGFFQSALITLSTFPLLKKFGFKIFP